MFNHSAKHRKHQLNIQITKHTFNHSAKQSTTAKHTDNKSAEHTNKRMFNHSAKHRKQQLSIQPTSHLNIQINIRSTTQLNTV